MIKFIVRTRGPGDELPGLSLFCWTATYTLGLPPLRLVSYLNGGLFFHCMTRRKGNRRGAKRSRRAGKGGRSDSGQVFTHQNQPQQKTYSMKVPGVVSKLVDVAGTLAAVLTVNFNLISSFAADWGSVFDEYRILKVVFEVRAMNPSQTGAALMYWDEDDNASPTSSSAMTHRAVEISNMPSAGVQGVKRMTWRCQNLSEEGWQNTSGAVFSYAYLKIYSDPASFGMTSLNAGVFIVRPVVTIQFRGIQ